VLEKAQKIYQHGPCPEFTLLTGNKIHIICISFASLFPVLLPLDLFSSVLSCPFNHKWEGSLGPKEGFTDGMFTPASWMMELVCYFPVKAN